MRTVQRLAVRASRFATPASFTVPCLLLAAVVSWSSVLLVVMGRVIPGWVVSGSLLVVALVLMGILAVRTRPASDPGPVRRRRWTRIVNGLLIAAAALGTVLGALGDLGAEYSVLRPAGPDGCRAVVRETSFLFAGSGRAYAVGPSGIAWGAAGSWVTDDGYRPVAEGTYELNWGPVDGFLKVRGTATEPVVSGGFADLDC